MRLCEKCDHYYDKCAYGKQPSESCESYRTRSMKMPMKSIYANKTLDSLSDEQKAHLGIPV